MRLVLFSHPAFMKSQSMPRYVQMLRKAYEQSGHEVEIWSPADAVYRRFANSKFAKWSGYVDQYIIFPRAVRRKIASMPLDTLFVFCDQALGPWVPLVKDRPHAIHVHDLLALRSALGDIPENPTAITGRIYQRYIRRGFRRGRYFISISEKTRRDLHEFGGVTTAISEVVYNGLNFPYKPMAKAEARSVLQKSDLAVDERGILLHVGGSQWYKNRLGVIALYHHYVDRVLNPLDLWCVGPPPDESMRAAIAKIATKGRVHFAQNLDDLTLQAAYSHARALIFPSLAEGFGWPLVEAQACGCPVITTDEPPMNEVAGTAARYLPRLRHRDNLEEWAARGASELQALLSADASTQAARSEQGQEWSRRFDAQTAIASYLRVYAAIVETYAMVPSAGERTVKLSSIRGSEL